MLKKIFFLIFVISILFACQEKDQKKSTDSENIAIPPQQIEYSNTLEDTDIIFACNQDYLPVLLKAIDESKYTIDIVHFQLNPDRVIYQILDKLKDAEKRDVKIRILSESELKDKTLKSYQRINKTNIQYKLDTERRKTHCKMFIFDRTAVLLGSTNLSYQSILNNNETNIYIKNSGLANYYTEYFNSLWRDSNKEPNLENFKLTNAEPIVNRAYLPKVKELITNSKKYIYIYMYGLRFDESSDENPIKQLLDLLIEAHNRGADVKLITELSDYNDLLNQFNNEVISYLTENGIEVRYDPKDKITHSKLVIIDDKVLIGSTNWGYGAMFMYNEANILLDIPKATNYFKDYFFKLWNLQIKQ